jgi:uncharacterized protein YjbJ (UPF0337 family)
LAAKWKKDSDERPGDVKTELQGKAKQIEGTLQDVYDHAKETATDAVSRASLSPSGS